ncbi:hypothetical protein NliqN6_0873 [Naganishia liquefaciens]|uniref:BZIP domain-containing protein n=1 Tax=Naganishia liquefaciens TaxID=104408 RepID=A0A8H3TPC9_9TREE|nr:hypothetical protein NliqN6_0873 [Naganishia liquefaciens]
MSAEGMMQMSDDVKPSVNMTLQPFPPQHDPGLLLKPDAEQALSTQNPGSVSLFSPWQALYSNANPFFTPQAPAQASAAIFPFPSPSLGFTFGDTFVPWPDLNMINVTPGAAGPSGMAPGSNGFPFPQQANQSQSQAQAQSQSQSQTLRKDSLQSLNNERQAPSRFDSNSSGVSTSAVSVALPSSTPECASTPMAHKATTLQSAPPQGYFQFQGQMPKYGNQGQVQGFATANMAGMVNTFPPAFGTAMPPFTWNSYTGYTAQQTSLPPSGVPEAPNAMNAPLVSRSSSTSTHHSAISPAMLSNMPSRMPSQSSAFAHLPDDDDALVTVTSSTAPSEYESHGLPSRQASPEIITKRDRKRRAAAQPGSRGPMCDNDIVSDAVSAEDDDAEGEADPEGIEKNGMMWGMKTEDYKALSARERKRVRNRISARTFRARRKEHLNVLESDLADRNSLIKASQDEIRRLRDENEELRRRLSKYEHLG